MLHIMDSMNLNFLGYPSNGQKVSFRKGLIIYCCPAHVREENCSDARCYNAFEGFTGTVVDSIGTVWPPDCREKIILVIWRECGNIWVHFLAFLIIFAHLIVYP